MQSIPGVAAQLYAWLKATFISCILCSIIFCFLKDTWPAKKVLVVCCLSISLLIFYTLTLYTLLNYCAEFHALCVDSWLTTWRSFCPVCKQDARAGVANLPASESTPLLSSGAATPPSTAALSSFHSSVASSPSTNLQIASTPPRSGSTSRTQFLSIPPHIPHPRGSHNHSSAISISRSFADLINASSHRSRSSHIVSPHSVGFPSSSPIHSRFASPYVPCSSNASPSYLAGSSSRQSYLQQCSESGASLSALASAQSLPGC